MGADDQELAKVEAAAGDQQATLHVSALDALVNVNSLFSGIVFIGITFSGNSLVAAGEEEGCNPTENTARKVVLFEVLAFAAYLLSSLIAQGLKLQLALKGAKKKVTDAFVPINEKLIRVGICVTALSTALGTLFLTLSMVFLVELRLGSLSCPSSAWSKGAAIPLIASVFIGILVFLGSVIYAEPSIFGLG